MSTTDNQVSATRWSVGTRSEVQFTTSGALTGPILLLARTGFIIRNFLLGKFAAEILQHCPLVVAVPDPLDPHLGSVIEDRNITLITFIEAVDDSPQLTRLSMLRRWHTYI
ncbi:MAG: hypothetical protein H0U53_02805, partial [Actinobacteria bacterium]|nr:hypothetical protein [Actinomycetota bacterium]